MRIKLDTGAFIPEKAHETDAGYDLRTPVSITVLERGYAEVDTGVHMEIPNGYYGRVASKSGLYFKSHLACEGVIDSAYRGAIKVMLHNLSDYDYTFRAGDKIAQLIIEPCENLKMEVVDELDETERGNGGFGSTGR